MIRVASTIFPGQIGYGCPASFHACTASGERMIPIPPSRVGLGAVRKE
jgi:hypothetical protein